MKRRFTLCSGSVLLCLVVSHCDYRVPRDPGVLVIDLRSDPSILNPITYTDASAAEVLNYLNDSLADRHPDTLAWRPKLAERWDFSPDHREMTFYLQHDVRWHDGHPFTAADVVYSFARIMDPTVDAAQLRVYYKDFARVDRLDDYTVRFVAAEPYYKAFEVAATMPIVPRHVFDDGTDFNKHPAGRHPIGTGPYQFAEWVTGRRIVLARNPAYWRAPPAIDGIAFRLIPEPAVAFQALKKGEIDYGGLRAIQFVRQTNSPKFQDRFAKYRYFQPVYSYIGWNLRRPYFSDARVRRALTMLIDRERILERILYGQGKLISGNFYPFHPSYDPSILPWPYDPAQAVQLLDAAGWIDRDGDGIRDKDGVPFRFNFLYAAGGRLSEALASILREDFRKVGILVESQQLEWTTLLKTVDDRAFDALFGAWSGGVEEDPYQIWHSSQVDKGSNYVGFAHREADRLIELARREFDPVQRAALYHQFHRILHAEQPYTFLYCLPALVAVDRRLTNVQAYALGFEQLEWGVKRDVELWQ